MAESNTISQAEQQSAANRLRSNKRPPRPETMPNIPEPSNQPEPAPEAGPEAQSQPQNINQAKAQDNASKKITAARRALRKAAPKKEMTGRQEKAAIRYNPIYFIFPLLLAVGYETTVLVVSLISASVTTYLDWIGDLTVLPILTVFMWSQGERDVKKRMIRILSRLLVAFGVEAIPYLDYLPMWTISVLWVWFSVWRRSKQVQS